MIKNITLRNFKCFDDFSIRTSGLTIITGENGAGKSSIVQALLLLRQSHRDKATDFPRMVKINGDLANLGSAKEIRCAYTDVTDVNITLTDDAMADDFAVTIPNAIDEETTKECHLSDNAEEGLKAMALFRNDFVYLYADRLIPQARYERGGESATDSRLGDKHGHLSVFELQKALDEGGEVPLEGLRRNGKLVSDNVVYWMNYVMDSDVTLGVEGQKDSAVTLQYTQTMNETGVAMSPMNMAFGYSYILPIVLALMTAPKGSLVIVENPEAHLHPSAQTRMGELAALAAKAGIQLIIETHSDHLLNGVRVAAKKEEVDAGNVAIQYVYQDKKKRVRYSRDIKLHSDGSLNEWPDGFFDEWEKTLKQLF